MKVNPSLFGWEHSDANRVHSKFGVGIFASGHCLHRYVKSHVLNAQKWTISPQCVETPINAWSEFVMFWGCCILITTDWAYSMRQHIYGNFFEDKLLLPIRQHLHAVYVIHIPKFLGWQQWDNHWNLPT